MSEAAAASASETTASSATRSGFLATLVGVYVAPGRAFRSIAARPRWDAPLALSIAVGLTFTAVWISRADPVEFMRTQMVESGAMERIPAEQRAAVLRGQAKWFTAFAWVAPLFVSPLACAAVAGLFYGIYRFFYAADIRYAQSFAVVTWTYAAYKLVAAPLNLLVMALTGEWSVDPESALRANLAALLDRETTAKPLYALAGSFDLLTLWALALLSIGYGAAIGTRASAAAWGVVVPWGLWVLGGAALAAIF
jgi:hypothetical protein